MNVLKMIKKLKYRGTKKPEKYGSKSFLSIVALLFFSRRISVVIYGIMESHFTNAIKIISPLQKKKVAFIGKRA